MSVVPMIATHHRDRIEREAAVENHSPDKHTPSIVGNDGEREHAYRDRGSAASDNRDVAFGPFRLFPSQQLLQEGDKAVRLGSRALDILIALVERAGELVSKNDLVAHVWPDTFVEEANLRVHIFALRRALRDGQRGQRYVVNVPGRGYRFVAPIIVSEGSLPSHSRPAAGPVRAYPPRPAASQSKQPAIGSENPSIAVLAFDNMSGDPTQ